MAEAKKNLRITQVKSSIGYKKDQLATLRSLGLGKIGRTVDQVDNDAIRDFCRRTFREENASTLIYKARP